jgi:hypothetical protein
LYFQPRSFFPAIFCHLFKSQICSIWHSSEPTCTLPFTSTQSVDRCPIHFNSFFVLHSCFSFSFPPFSCLPHFAVTYLDTCGDVFIGPSRPMAKTVGSRPPLARPSCLLPARIRPRSATPVLFVQSFEVSRIFCHFYIVRHQIPLVGHPHTEEIAPHL